MVATGPFMLTEDDVRRAGLQRGDIGAWCFVYDNCFHLFDCEASARRAYELFLKGHVVR